MECKCYVGTPTCMGASATVKYENGELILFRKPGWIKYIFGIVGEALAPTKERERINISDIKSATLRRSWTDKPIFKLFLENADEYELDFNEDNEMTKMLIDILGERLTTKR